jgi:hypothetical protein
MVRKLGIDLGTTNLLICSDNNGVIVDEPAVITIDAKTKKCIAAGLEAREMVGRTPKNMICIRPLKDGVVADYEATDLMLNYFLKKCNLRGMFSRNVILICHPTKITSVEKNAIRDCAYRAGAKKVYLEEEPKVAALGAGLEIGKDLYIPGGNRELFEAAAIFDAVFSKCSVHIDKDISKHRIKTLDGADYLVTVETKDEIIDPDYKCEFNFSELERKYKCCWLGGIYGIQRSIK